MPEKLGNIFIHAALVLSLYSVVASIIGARTEKHAWVKSGRNAVWGLWILVATCAGLLVGSLLTGRYHIKYVYQYSNSTMPTFYKVAALWGGQEGSILFWLLILMTYSSIVMLSNRQKNQELMPYVTATLMTIASFFLILLVFSANPFDVVPFAVQNGKGLNPLLQNYYMVIHPPSLYLGYVGMSVPFSFAMAALITGRLDNLWVIQIRRWVLTAWFFLSMGNLLGASWAYEVLGWGGYWGWDPVENAAFMPWLSATAFLHSVIIQEKRGILKTWNMVLVVLSFLLTLTGTFLTRSGIISSVHSFAQSDIGTYFLSFLVFTLTVSISLIIYRLKELQSKNTFDSLLSRESTFLFNNLVLVGAAFAILWGTLFPVLSEAVRGTKITVGPPFFNSVMIPIGLVLLALTGIGPMVAWRKTTPDQLKRNFILPVAVTVITSMLVSIFVSRSLAVILSFSLSAFVLATIVLEYQRGIAVRIRTLGEDAFTAFLRLIDTNKRRYGGYVVHFGVVLLFIGFTGNAFKKESDLQLKINEKTTIGDYNVQYVSLTSTQDDHKEEVFANLNVYKGNQFFAVVSPSRIFYKSFVSGEPPQPNTHVAIQRTLKEDFYAALLSFDSTNQAAFLKIVINPLVNFIWIGGLFIILGTVIVMSPSGKKQLQQSLAKAAMFAAILLSAVVATSMVPTNSYALTVEDVAKKLKCQCGCNFPDLASCTCGEWAIPAKDEIAARLSRGEDEATILKFFIQRDGEKVLTVPVQQGFNRTAWIIPILALGSGLVVVTVLVRAWTKSSKSAADENQPKALTSQDDSYVKELDKELYGDSTTNV